MTTQTYFHHPKVIQCSSLIGSQGTYCNLNLIDDGGSSVAIFLTEESFQTLREALNAFTPIQYNADGNPL